MSTLAPADLVKDIATRLSGAAHSRKLYAAGSPVWLKTLGLLNADLQKWFAANPKSERLTIGRLGESLAIGGVPVVNPPPPVLRLVAQIKLREIEIISCAREVQPSEVEALLEFLTAEAAEVAAVDGEKFLKDRGVSHIELRHLSVREKGQAPALKSFRDVFKGGQPQVGAQFAKARTEGTVDVGPMAELAKSMLSFVGGDVPVATLLAMRDRDDCQHVHSMNVSLIAGLQARAFGLEEAQVEEIATAGLLHDIGKSRVPDTVLLKRTPLSPQEKAMLAAHTTEGARMLLRSHGGDRLAAMAAYEHHGLRDPNQKPLLASQFIGLADVFDSLRSLKPFDARHHLRGALVWMMESLHTRFSPWVLNRFASLGGLFLPGDYAHLSTGEVARVVRIDAQDATRPVVEVVDTALGELESGTELTLTTRPELSVKLPAHELFDGLALAELDALG